MPAYILRRVLMLFPTLLGVSIIVFLMLHITPGDPAELMLGERATDAAIQEIREHLGLNKPLYVQYGLFIGRLLQGDLGETIMTQQKVWIEVKERFPATIELTFAAMIISCFLGVIFGIISAIRQHSIFDYLSMIGALIGVSMPIFWLGLVLMLIFSLFLRWLPMSGRLTIGVDLDASTQFYILDAILSAKLDRFERCALAFDPSGHYAEQHPHGHCRPDDPIQHARCASAGLHQNRQGQGPFRIQGRYQACPSKCPDSGCYDHRASVRHSSGRRNIDRNDFCLAGRGEMDV